tara:strand:- start:103182 stop:103517 length:336 start_codon:yes stop_codon:yes gene_type:complete
MYNTNSPSQNDLPSTGRLIKSTIIAAIVALALLVTVVMPAEYGIDPTGIGQTIGLTDMGDIKTSLDEEAASDAVNHSTVPIQKTQEELIEKVNPAPSTSGHRHGSGSYHNH